MHSYWRPCGCFAGSALAQTPQSSPISLESEVTEMRAQSGAMRAQLRKLEEQQKEILRLMDKLRRKLDGRSVAIAPRIQGSVTYYINKYPKE